MRTGKNINPSSARLLAVAAALSVICGCSGGRNAQTPFKPLKFPYVEAPVMMDNAAKFQYIATHFWDNMADSSRHCPCDSTLVNGVARAEVEQAVAAYAVMLAQMPLRDAQDKMRGVAAQLIANEAADTSRNVLEATAAIIDSYFYDPNSPLRDEDIYRPFADAMSKCGYFPESKRIAYAKDASDASLNERGSRAADFSFTDRRGRVYSLYGIKSQWIILFFSNPGCTACKEIIETLGGTEEIQEKIASGELSVLNIYIDEQLDEWYKYMPIYPDNWYNGYDHNHIIRDENLYNARAIPSLYLLDRNKTVLLKDAPLERLMNNLPWHELAAAN